MSIVPPGRPVGGPQVYDVTKYLDEHPGGSEVMLDHGGKYADEFFEDIGHSSDAREILKKYAIGVVAVRPSMGLVHA